jgi:hypothetical protein
VPVLGPSTDDKGTAVIRRIHNSRLTRSRWAAIGAAVAVSLGAGGIGLIAHAANSNPSSFVSITPCRLFDTRPATLVGDRNTPLNTGEEFVRQVWGANGNCTIPSNATAISYNITVPTGVDSFLTVFPADATRPNSSSINPVRGESIKANGGIVGLSAAGAIKIYTHTGPVDALLDITGYYFPSAAGPDAYVAYNGGGLDSTELTSTVLSVAVPAGSYVVNAKLYGLASAGGTANDHSILCSLMNGVTQVDFTHLSASGTEYRNLTLQGSITLASAGTLDLTCSAQAVNSATIAAYRMFGMSLTAIRVGALH